MYVSLMTRPYNNNIKAIYDRLKALPFKQILNDAESAQGQGRSLYEHTQIYFLKL